MRLRTVTLACLAATVPAVVAGQGYTLRPGPRGFDSRLNRYGATEEAEAARAEDEEDGFDASRTTVKVELLQEGNGGGLLSSQDWSRRLAELGYPARIRRPILNDKPEVSEAVRGTLRYVTAVGTLDRRGNLVFPGRTFTPGDAAELGEWLDGLKRYGAQGSPEGQPMWGLSKSQFEAVYSSLSRPVAADVSGLRLGEAIDRLALPAEYAVRFSNAAKTAAEAGAGGGVSRSVGGLSAGTALAFVLNEYGLGFRPDRTPKGEIELLVEPSPEAGAAEGAAELVQWPVGWEVEEAAGPAGPGRKTPVRDEDAVPPLRVQMAPSLYSMAEIGFEDVPLAEAFAAVEAGAGLPVLTDRAGAAAAGIEVGGAKANFPARRTSWNIALRSMTFPHRLRHELRRDEGGRPFVWVTPLRLGAKAGR